MLYPYTINHKQIPSMIPVEKRGSYGMDDAEKIPEI